VLARGRRAGPDPPWDETLAHWTAHYGGSPLDWGEDIRLYRLVPSWMVGYAFERERLLASRGVQASQEAPAPTLSSERFRTLWARHDVRGLEGGTTTVNHPVVGELHLHRDKLPVDDLLLVLYYADQGSQSDEKLRLLASIALTTPTPAPAGSATAELNSHAEPHGDLTAER
jgi:hypothetical protein